MNDLHVSRSQAVEAASLLEPEGRVAVVRRLTGGVSAAVALIEIETPRGPRRVVYRRHPESSVKQRPAGVAAKEFAVLSALHGLDLAVPEPLALVDHGSGTPPAVLMEWIDGVTDLGGPLPHRSVQQLAGFLARLHALDPGSIAVAELETLEDPLTELPRYLPDSAIGPRLQAIAQTGELTVALNPPVVVHGDYWPGNVLWQGETLAAVIDWEDCGLADPLADLATARVELLCSCGAEAMDEFTDSYLAHAANEGVALHLESLPLWEAYCSAAALASMDDWGLGPAELEHRKRHTQAFFEQAAVQLVDRA